MNKSRSLSSVSEQKKKRKTEKEFSLFVVNFIIIGNGIYSIIARLLKLTS